MLDLARNPGDRFSCDVAHMSHAIQTHVFCICKKTKAQIGGRVGLMVSVSDSGARGLGFDPHSGR